MREYEKTKAIVEKGEFSLREYEKTKAIMINTLNQFFGASQSRSQCEKDLDIKLV